MIFKIFIFTGYKTIFLFHILTYFWDLGKNEMKVHEITELHYHSNMVIIVLCRVIAEIKSMKLKFNLF